MIYKAKIISNKEKAKDLFHLKLKVSPDFSVKPGQFINILIDNNFNIFLRRPFSVFDFSETTLEIIYKIVGKGTEALTKKKPGEIIDFLGPLGNSYSDFLNEQNKENDIILIGGGTGIASLNFFSKFLKHNKIKFKLIYGTKTKDEIIFLNKFKALNTIFTTDDGSLGLKGFAMDALKKVIKKNSKIFACGPESMLKSLQKLNLKNEIYASFEAYMGCAIGVCLSCVIAIKENKDFEYKRVCEEGTIFDLKKVNFDKG